MKINLQIVINIRAGNRLKILVLNRFITMPTLTRKQEIVKVSANIAHGFLLRVRVNNCRSPNVHHKHDSPPFTPDSDTNNVQHFQLFAVGRQHFMNPSVTILVFATWGFSLLSYYVFGREGSASAFEVLLTSRIPILPPYPVLRKIHDKSVGKCRRIVSSCFAEFFFFFI